MKSSFVLYVGLRLMPYLIAGCAVGASLAAVLVSRRTAEVVIEYHAINDREFRAAARLWAKVSSVQACMDRDLKSDRERIEKVERFVELILNRVDGDVDSPPPIGSAAGTKH